MCNNRISRIEGQNIGKALPNVETVNLASNRLALLSEIDELAGLTSLSTLILVDNPVTLRKHYRLYAIHKLPSLKHLDFKKIKPNERELAARLFASGDGKRVVRAVADMAALAAEKETTRRKVLTDEQKAAIHTAIMNAKTPQEVDRLERMLQAGIYPEFSDK